MHRFVVPESKLCNRLYSYKIKNIYPILDYAVEINENPKEFETKYTEILNRFPNNIHAIKLSNVNFDHRIADTIVNHAIVTNNRIMIDAEEARVQERVDDIVHELIEKYDKYVFKTYQMYRTDSIDNLVSDMEYFRCIGKQLNIKLVRGAYLHTDRYSGLLYETKHDTDEMYNHAAKVLMENEQFVGDVVFGTHNRESFDLVKHSNNHYHASLMGFDEPLSWNGTIKKMVYLPFGPLHKAYPYLLRRLYENPSIFRNVFQKTM